MHARSEVTNTLLHVQQSNFVKVFSVRLNGSQNNGTQCTPDHAHSSKSSFMVKWQAQHIQHMQGCTLKFRQGRKLGSTATPCYLCLQRVRSSRTCKFSERLRLLTTAALRACSTVRRTLPSRNGSSELRLICISQECFHTTQLVWVGMRLHLNECW